MGFPIDPRQGKDPIGVYSAQTRYLRDILTEGVVSSLSKATASNYFSDKYGPNHRIIYEGVGEIIAQILIDSIDLTDDFFYSEMRPEYVSTRLLYSIYDPEGIPTAQGSQGIIQILSDTILSLVQGSTHEAISELLPKVTGGESQVQLDVVSDFIAKATTSLLGLTSKVNSHTHLVAAKSTGLGSTGAPIQYSWGDDLHTHEIIDGVVQPHTDGHTHTVSFGLKQDAVTIQDNISKAFDVVRPAHVKLGDNSTLLDETAPEPSFSLSLSLGSLHQEDLRRVREGAQLSQAVIYAGNMRDIFIPHSSTKPKLGTKLTFNNLTKIISSVEEITAPDGVHAWTAPRYALGGYYNNIDSGAATITDGYWVPTAVPNPTNILTDGEIILIDGVAYFTEIMGEYGVEDPANFRDKRVRLRSLKVTLDSVVGAAGVYTASFLDVPFSPPKIIYGEVSGVVSGLSFYLPDYARHRIGGSPVLPEHITSSVPFRYYDPFQRRLRFNGVADGTAVTVQFPIDFYEEDNIYGLNDTRFILNAARQRGAVEGGGGRGGDSSNPLPSQGMVLYPSVRVIPKTTERREITTGILGSNTLNGVGVGLYDPSNPLGGFTLNRYQTDYGEGRVSAPASGSAPVEGGRLYHRVLGFRPDYLISIVDGLGNSYAGKLYSGYIEVTGATEGDTLTVTALSSKPYESADWFTGEIRVEGQAPLAHSSSATSSITPDDVMDNPLGLPNSVRKISQELEEVESGVYGEMVFYEDMISEMTLSGFPFNATQPVFVDRPYRPAFILGGGLNQGSRLDDLSSLSSDLNVLAPQVKITLL